MVIDYQLFLLETSETYWISYHLKMTVTNYTFAYEVHMEYYKA